ncbi:NACHT domain protein [Okeania sp. SIO2B3]|uniref:NACHT domain protein n=1 Tax=Okeania sp. SIO2B3 TaxID=2607784 RepID=UPI0013C0FC68|nr:NACHT domain protein [Okeania sp. SIO2B3]NET44017.1 NACHT domain protein [Okeania sp. SIO2B3]
MLDNIVKTIINTAKSAVPQAIDAAQRNELVVNTLKKLKLDPTQPPKDVDGVYVYALVEYGVDKNEPILKLFREKEIKNAFWSAYTSNNPMGFYNKVEEFLDWNILGDEIRELGVDVRSELEEFGRKFIDVAKRTKSPEFRPYPDWNFDEYPAEFKSLIMEKIKGFCGREFVFKEFGNFINKNSNGYFTVVGDAGMGKSAIAAKYVYDHKSPCHFNIRADGRNKPELFLESIRKQLIRRYELQNTDKVNLSALLQNVSENLGGQKLVIVVDALDEVEQSGGGNILDFPTTLPDGVYFFLTRRPYERDNKRLSVSPGVGMTELDLRGSEYRGLSRDDVKEYIGFMLNADPDYGVKLQKWVEEQKIKKEDFIEQVADKSENNFMYLRYVLPDIAKDIYRDLSLRELPDGLQDYYQDHWKRMGMEDRPQKDKVIVLFILVESRTLPSLEVIAEWARQDESDVEDVLKEWVEFLSKQEVEGEVCYSIYHASFLDFLKGKRKLDSARKLFEEVNARMADDLYSDV